MQSSFFSNHMQMFDDFWCTSDVNFISDILSLSLSLCRAWLLGVSQGRPINDIKRYSLNTLPIFTYNISIYAQYYISYMGLTIFQFCFKSALRLVVLRVISASTNEYKRNQQKEIAKENIKSLALVWMDIEL